FYRRFTARLQDVTRPGPGPEGGSAVRSLPRGPRTRSPRGQTSARPYNDPAPLPVPHTTEAGMRLVTLKTRSGPRLAVRAGDDYVALKATDAAFPGGVRALLAGGPELLEHAARAAQRPSAVRVPAASAALMAPVPDPQKIVCLGLNYRDHAAETNA